MSAPNYSSHPFLGLQIDTGVSRQPGYQAFVLAQDPMPMVEPDEWLNPPMVPLFPGEEPPVPDGGFGRMSVSMKRATCADGTPCQSLDEVEDLAIRDMVFQAQTMPRPGDIFEIRRAMSAIAKETRRGMGNVVLMHPATAYEFRANALIGQHHSVFSMANTPVEESHGWNLFLRSSHSLGDIWVKRTVPEGVALVLYKGNGAFDCGYLAVGHWSRPVYLRNDYGQHKADAYARIVKF